MLGETVATLSAFKSMLDIAKGLKDLEDVAARNAVAIELQEKILAAREAQTALLDRIGELEKEKARFETWEAEKKRYKLTDFGAGTFAYSLKPEEANGEPPHRICADVIRKTVSRFCNLLTIAKGRITLIVLNAKQSRPLASIPDPILAGRKMT